MNEKTFRNYDEMLQECAKLITDDEGDAEDRATICAFYNGRETMSESEAKSQGIKEITNHLLGYDSLAASKEQITSLVTKSPTTFIVESYNAPMMVRDKWSMQVTEYLNEAINASRRLKVTHESIAGEATLVGSGFYCFMDPYDWCPSSRRPLVPLGTSTLANEIPYAMVPDSLSLAKLYEIRSSSKRLELKGVKSKWNMKAIEDCIKFLEGNVGNASTISGSGVTNSMQTRDEQETSRQSGNGGSSFRSTIPVYYVYQTRLDEPDRPVDVTLLARYTPDWRASQAKDGNIVDFMLYDRERLFKKPKDWLHPLFLDASLGGEASWHRVMGLGRLNYDSDVDTERFFNAAMQGSMEQLLRTYTVESSADADMVERWASGEGMSNVLPDGVKIAEMGKSPGFQYAFNTIQMLQSNSRRNANMALSNSGGQSGGAKQVNELEVQALERQGRNAEAISNRINEVYDTIQGVGERIFMSFLRSDVLPLDKGYPEIAYFQHKLKDAKIPIEFFREMHHGRPKNWCLKVNRVAGDGDKVRETMTNRMLMGWLDRFSPEAQQKIMRRVIASETNDYALSEELIPIQQTPDFKQQSRAQNEDETMIRRAMLQPPYVAQIQPDDVHLVHVQEHLQDMGALVAAGQGQPGPDGNPTGGAWGPPQFASFMSIGRHAGQHIQAINVVNKNLGKQLLDQLQQLTKLAEGLQSNAQRAQEALQKALSPADQANLTLKAAQFHQGQIEHQDMKEHRQTMAELAYAKEGRNAADNSRRIALEEGNADYQHLADLQDTTNKRVDSILAGEGKGKTPHGGN